ncbi:MFS transporter [Zophobihabitans entericus]|uniref:MFS transporter n=1 Tax=Zophobihabitans entericus TaxID=1635327 RepID=A0A6G9ICZ2_9GAMM|nr:MFS transporter [Zophobihabitans entericus]QIQ21574.1 MFS transporter [Zophobihabitans entericus]
MKKTHLFNWYFGWNIVAATVVLTLLSSGMRMSLGVFLLPISHDLGFSRSLLSGMIAIGMLFYGLAMPVAGYLVGRYGTRFVLLLGTVIIVISSVWTVWARDPINFFLAFGIASSFGLAFVSSISFTQIISHWFTRQRGMALFFLSTGGMAGIAVMIPVFTFTIEWFGWQNTILGFAVIFTLLAIPTAIWIIREDVPEQTDLLPDSQNTTHKTTSRAPSPLAHLTLSQILQTKPFWLLCLGLFACGFSMNLLGTHGVPMLMDHGFDNITSSYGIGLIGLVAIFSTIILGKISDLVQRRNILAVIYFVRALGFIGLVAATSKWQLFTVSIIGGFVWSGTISLSAAIMADVYGVKQVGLLTGLTYLGHQVGAMVSSWLGGFAYEAYQTHWIAFGMASIFLVLAAAISITLPTRQIIK